MKLPRKENEDNTNTGSVLSIYRWSGELCL